MKKIINKIGLKGLIFIGSAILALLIALIIKLICNSKINSLDEQMAWKRWGNISECTQATIFFDSTYGYTYFKVREFENTIEKKLTEASVVSESENANARQWIDAYSVRGEFNYVGEAGKSEGARTYGVGCDFFEFHPLKLVTGSYFSDESLMKDYILLDKDLAWQLFGSYDIIGKQVWVDNTPLMIVGVYDRPDTKMNNAAGNNVPTAYISYSMFNTLNGGGGEEAHEKGIDSLEIVLPNVVKGFGFKMLTDNFKGTENKYSILENATRYDFLNLLKVVGGFGKRSMSMNGIIYPYWENVARGYEDILSLFLLIRLVLYLYALVIAIIYIVIWLKSIPWKQIKEKIADKYDDFRSSDHSNIKDFFKKLGRNDEEL